jgi:hypothetical protein
VEWDDGIYAVYSSTSLHVNEAISVTYEMAAENLRGVTAGGFRQG